MSERLDLLGKEVAITGRLASMTRADAVELIGRAGARTVTIPGPFTDMLVLGRGGPPLGGDGRLTVALRKAHELQQGDHPIAIVPEDELLDALGLTEHKHDLERLYTTGQLSRMLDVPNSLIRSWVRHELIRPVKVVNRLCYFDWPQVSSARALVALARDGVRPSRLRRSLAQLARWLDEEHPALTQLEALEPGGPLVVRLPDGRLAETTGQLRLGFDGPPDPAPPTAPASLWPRYDAAERQAATADASIEAWFGEGVEAEGEGLMGVAREAYERALALGGLAPEVCFNLGNVLYVLGLKTEAAERFAQATDLEPDYVEAWNNLGNVFNDLGRLADAETAYRRALMIAPDYADAHYNLAETLAGRGDHDGARAHWQAYLAQDPHSTWARHVQTRLERQQP